MAVRGLLVLLSTDIICDFDGGVMTVEQLFLRMKSLTEAKSILYDTRVGCNDYGAQKLYNAYAHLYRQSLAVSKQIDAYFAEVA